MRSWSSQQRQKMSSKVAQRKTRSIILQSLSDQFLKIKQGTLNKRKSESTELQITWLKMEISILVIFPSFPSLFSIEQFLQLVKMFPYWKSFLSVLIIVWSSSHCYGLLTHLLQIKGKHYLRLVPLCLQLCNQINKIFYQKNSSNIFYTFIFFSSMLEQSCTVQAN